MAFLSTNTAIAIAVQSAPGAWTQPSNSTDIYPCGNVRVALDPITAENPEYLGTIHRPAPFMLGKKASVTITMPIRPPGGASPPSAGAYIPGRVLRAAGFTENLISAAIPPSAEPLGSGSTTTAAKLGTTAAGTAQLYKGLALFLSDNGASYNRRMTAIRSYAADKLATLFEVLSAAPAANYQIPRQLAYQLSASATPPNLAVSVWYQSVRYDLNDMTVSSLRFTFPTSTRDSTDFPIMEVTLDGDLYAFADEAVPTPAALGGIPVFKDGDMWLANKALGGSSVSCDLGIQVGYAPNPNRLSGNDPAQMTETRRTVSLTLNHATKAANDLIALADEQSLHGLWLQYGRAAGEIVAFNVPQGRFSFPNPDNSGAMVTQSVDLMIDDAEKAINLCFMY
jgi:hypothetical protein